MIKKILSCIFSFVLIMTLFTGVSFAENTASSQSNDFNFAVSVGIMPSALNPAAPITRAELAQCYANVLVGQPEFEQNVKSRFFSDVPDNMAGYADTVAAAGIMGGIGEGLFAPDAKVTYAQLAKTFVSFLGFDVKAQNMGGYPSGYLAMAAWLGLIDKAPEESDSYVTCERVATMFKRGLNAPLMQMVTFGGKVEYQENYTINYLAKYMGIYYFRGVIEATYITNVLGAGKMEYNEIMAGNTVFLFDPLKHPLGDMLGYNIDFYYEVLDGKNHIVYFEDSRNSCLSVGRKEVGGYHGGEIYYFKGSTEYVIPMAPASYVIYNGTVLQNYNSSSFTPWDSANCDGGIKAIDNNGDGVYDFIFIDAYETYVVKSVSENTIFLQYRDKKVLELGNYIDGKDVLFRNYIGEPVKLSEVSAGNVLSVSKDKNGKLTNIVVTKDSFSSELEKYERVDGEYFFTLEGKTFTSSNSLKLNPQLDRLKVGARIRLMFNKEGLVSDVETVKFQTTEAGYLVEVYKGEGLNAEKDIQIKVFMASDKFEDLYFNEKVKVAYGLETLMLKPSEVIDLFGYESSGYVVRQPIFIGKNLEGKIDYIEICDPDSGPIDGFHKMSTEIDGISKEFRVTSNSLFNQILLSNTVSFTVPPEAERFAYEKYLKKGMDGGVAYQIEAWGHSADGRIASVIVINTSVNAYAKYLTDYFMVVDSIKEVLDEEGLPACKVVGYINKAVKEYVIDESCFNVSGNLPKKGDVVKLSVNRAKKVADMEILFDSSSKTMPNYSNPSSGVMGEPRYFYGKIIWDDEKSYKLEMLNAVGVASYEYFIKSAGFNTIRFNKINTNESRVSIASPSDFYSVGNYADEKTVFMVTKRTDPVLVVIYDN